MPGLIRFSKCKGFFDQIVKGHLISKLFFGVIDILQKTNERIRLYYYDTSGRLVFIRFLEEIDDPKKAFNYRTRAIITRS